MLFNITQTGATADEVWLRWYDLLASQKDEQVSRDGDVVGEVLNAVTVIEDPTRCIMTNPVRKMSMRYAVGELLWYMSGENRLDAIRPYTKAWDRMSDDGFTVNSNYGYCIKQKFGFNQWDMVKKQLLTSPETRQAVIHIKEARDLWKHPSNDVNCTVCLQFFVRGGKLYMTTYMRSNDLWMGFPFDVFNFTAMQVLMAMELGLELGNYTHIAGSLHLYKRDYITAESRKQKEG